MTENFTQNSKSIAKKLFDRHLLSICNIISAAGGEIRVVGGAVRDLLVDPESDIAMMDIDLATNLLPAKIQEIFIFSHFIIIPTGIEFGTVTIIPKDRETGNKEYQITTLRKDVLTDGRHAKVEFGSSWEEDAARRDFTINAMSLDQNGQIYDYFGGINDLKNSIVKFIGDGAKRIDEDYLRILRYYRFAGRFGQNYDNKTRDICKSKKHLLSKLSIERIYDEFCKIFKTKSWRKIISTMLEDSILQEILGTDKLKIDALTKIYLPQNNIGFLPEIVISLLLKNIADINFLKKIFYTRKSLDFCLALLNFSHGDMLKNDSDKFFYYTNKYFVQFLVFCASSSGQISSIEIDELYNKYSNRTPTIFPVSGKDLLGIGYQCGQNIGTKLKKLENFWIESDFKLTKNALLEIARSENEGSN